MLKKFSKNQIELSYVLAIGIISISVLVHSSFKSGSLETPKVSKAVQPSASAETGKVVSSGFDRIADSYNNSSNIDLEGTIRDFNPAEYAAMKYESKDSLGNGGSDTVGETFGRTYSSTNAGRTANSGTGGESVFSSTGLGITGSDAADESPEQTEDTAVPGTDTAANPIPDTSGTDTASDPIPDTGGTDTASDPIPDTSGDDTASNPIPDTSGGGGGSGTARSFNVDDVYIQGDSSIMGMKITSSHFAKGAFLVETTGARFEYVKGQLKLYQGLDKANRRLLSTLTFENEPEFIKVEDSNDHILFWSKDLNIGIYGDSTLVFSPKARQMLFCQGNFKPDYEGRHNSELLLIDDKGGMEIYPQRYEKGYEVKRIELGRIDWVADYKLNTGERVMIAAFPGKAFDWDNSFKSNILITHGSNGTDTRHIYGKMPPDSIIKQWSQNFDILIVFWKGLYTRPKGDINLLFSDSPYIVEDEAEFRRLVKTAHNNNMKVAAYTSFFAYYNDFKKSEPYIEQIIVLRDKYNIDGVYIDGLSFDFNTSHDDNKILNWEIVRRIRKLFGSEGVVVLHGTHLIKAKTANPVAAAPNIDSYCTATLNGEGVPFTSVGDAYIRYQVRKYGISNTIGLWRPDGEHPNSIDYKGIADAVIRMNCRQESHSWMMMNNNTYSWSNGLVPSYLYYLDKLEVLKQSYK
ncbi:MAG: hypothetical protein A2Y13_11605 [Planctomycetes bacterium GWC2_45_44]|nr:MAG: hypothetical protein A2Y13_11605 [Planctomycetes bacterium GWC2_45_44]HBR18944.1 hypothetical protein [Phycisphaerales bacterium]